MMSCETFEFVELCIEVCVKTLSGIYTKEMLIVLFRFTLSSIIFTTVIRGVEPLIQIKTYELWY